MFAISARTFGLTGAALVLAAVAHGASSYLRAGPISDVVSDLGLLPLIVALQVLIASWVLRNVLGRGHVLLRVLSLAFIGSFVVAYGWYLLLTPRGFLVGMGDLLYLLAALPAAGARMTEYVAGLGSDQA